MQSIPDGAALRRRFDQSAPATVGIEEEVMLLHPDTLDLLPRAGDVIREAAHPGIGAELPAAQIELRTTPHETVGSAVAELARLRAHVAAIARPIGRLAAAGTHPFASGEGVLNTYGRYGELLREYGPALQRQLVCALHVHVAIRPSSRALGVYNAIRAFLPEIAALAANCPFYCGQDSGYASIRPKICESLPRQGVPPVLHSLDQLAAEYDWSARAGGFASAGSWWWEARLNPAVGTLEIRVPDAQTTLERTAVVAALIHSLAVRLAQRFDAEGLPEPVPTWRIEHNRWRACRHGLDAHLADPVTGTPRPARERWAVLLDELAPVAAELGCSGQIERARLVIRKPTMAETHRKLVAAGGTAGLATHLAEQFLTPLAD